MLIGFESHIKVAILHGFNQKLSLHNLQLTCCESHVEVAIWHGFKQNIKVA